MISTSALYNSIFADENHVVEWKITVNGTAYEKDKIAASAGGDSRPKLKRSLLPGNEPTIGGCVAATFSCAIFEASSAVPRMATVVPAYRLCLEGATPSEWITLGTFYIDTRQVDKATGALILTCYDKMLVADGAGGATYADLTGYDEWPQPMSAVAAEIAAIMEISLDPRTVVGSGDGYKVDYPGDLTMREVLSNIGVANAGNWCITPANSLRLVPLTGGSDTFNLGAAVFGLKTSPAFASWTGVTVYWDDEEAYEAGTDTGRVLTCDCPWATQATANGILTALSGSAYQPYTSEGAIINLALELGDIVTVGLMGDQVIGPVFTINITGGALEQASISAPGEDEIDHEYPYASYMDRSLKRKVGLNKSYYGVTLSRQKGIEIARGDGASEALFNSDTFAMRALIDGVMRDRIYFDPIKGDYIFDGALGADAVFTDSLYAETGDVAELTVDRLSTSRRIRKYILQDTSDDNYILAQDQYLRFITGTPSALATLLTENWEPLLTEGGEQLLAESNTYSVVQARNRYGELLYWQREPVSHTSDGYPLDDDGVQIYASTNATDWPVYMYSYTEQVKAEFAFNLEDGVYVPQIVLGAGDENGRTIGRIHKGPDGLDFAFTTSAGDEVGFQALSAGFLDLLGLRKPTELDFSDWDNGRFSETLDGGMEATFDIDFDAQDRPIKFTDGDGHETVVTWDAV